MKTSKFSAVLMLGVAYLIGFVIGGVAGFNPVVSGIVSTTGSLMVKNPNGVLAAGLDLSELATELGTYINLKETAKSIWTRMYNELELMQYMRKISNQRGKYIGTSSTSSELLQGFQKAFTPKGEVKFTPYANDIFRVKIDFLIDNIDELVDSYAHFMADETKTRDQWPFVKYIVQEHFIPQLIEEMDIAMCRGVYVAPTPGTPGTLLGSMNGLLTIISNEITASNLIPFNTGVTDSTNGVDNFEAFADSIDTNLTDKGGVILTSKQMERFYKNDYRTTFGGTNDKAAKNNTSLDNYDIDIVGLKAWGASQRMLFTPTGVKGNLLYLFDKIFMPGDFEVQKEKRDVILMADWHAAVGFHTLDVVNVNDQA